MPVRWRDGVLLAMGVWCSPTGRIINRISKDQGDVDIRLPLLWSFFLNMGFQILTTVGVIAYSVPWFLLLLIPMAGCCKSLHTHPH